MICNGYSRGLLDLCIFKTLMSRNNEISNPYAVAVEIMKISDLTL